MGDAVCQRLSGGGETEALRFHLSGICSTCQSFAGNYIHMHVDSAPPPPPLQADSHPVLPDGSEELSHGRPDLHDAAGEL